MSYHRGAQMPAALKTRLFVPNTVTAANIVVGFFSMLAAADGRYEFAVYLLLVSILLDMLDGRLARWLKATSKFGQEMDSFSDALSFCAAPAFLAHQAVLQPLRGFGVVVSLIYLLAGVYRLARFNLTSDVHSKARTTTGVPTPIAAGYLMALTLMRDRIPAPAAAAVVLVMAMLMVSRIHLPEMRGKSFLGFTMLVGLGNYLAVVAWPNWYTIAWWNVWNFVILAAGRADDTPPELSGSSP